MSNDYEPDEALRLEVERAAAACPVQAIGIERADEPFVGNARPGAKEEHVS